MLTAVMSKPYEQIFNEFQGGNTQAADAFGSGDVKYHLGASSDRVFDDNQVHLTMNANPSHLEAVNPVVLGRSRAKQEMIHKEVGRLDRSVVMPLLLHGDAAFAGQGDAGLRDDIAACVGGAGGAFSPDALSPR